MATIRSVDSFLYLGSLYSHLTVIVGQRLCATLGSHHHHHHHYISSDVSSEQRRSWVHYSAQIRVPCDSSRIINLLVVVALQYQCNYKKYRE